MADPLPLDELRGLCRDPLPHPDNTELRTILDRVTSWSLQDFFALPEQSIGTTATRSALEETLREPPPLAGQPIAGVLRELHDKVSPFAIRPSHPRFLAFVPGAPTFVSVLGDWLSAASNFFCGVWLEAAGPSFVEVLVLDWFKEFLGYPAGASGVLTSGGSEANLLALVAARDHLSFEDRQRTVLYVSDQRHGSIDRAAHIMGLRPEQIRSVPCDHAGRIRCEALAPAVREDRRAGRVPWTVVANAGATNTGAVDPLEALADFSQENRLWLHVDAAYGWPAVLVDEGKRLLRGIERADSITLDPHKWFAQTFDVGCVLVREGRLLEKTFALRADYLQDVVPNDDEVNFADRGLALTRRFRALKIWLSLKVLGLDWFRMLIEHCMRLADLAQMLLQRRGQFEILSPRQLSILCFRHVVPGLAQVELDEHNLALSETVRKSGRAFLSTTRIAGRVALRMCFVNWRTTAADVDEVVELLSTTLTGD